MALRAITGFHKDDAGSWVAELVCGHRQHVRHEPPWQERAWVTTDAGRRDKIGQMLSCLFCDMPQLPAAAIVYKTTRHFDAETLPKGLRADHRTKAGTWGRIVVLQGTLLYSLAPPSTLSWVLRPGIPGIIAPNMPHKVTPQPGLCFFIEFLQVPGGVQE